MSSYFEVKPVAGAQFMFNLKAGNHEVVLTSESYASRQSVDTGIESVRTNSVQDSSYERRTATDKSPYFVLTAANAQVIGRSQMYSSTSAMEAGIASVKAGAPTAKVTELS
jgi:uncharacterized protein YegP (UPF0339 family)